MRVAVVTPIPTPYRDAFWNAVSTLKEVELSVYYCATRKADQPWEGRWERSYGHEVLPGENLLGNWARGATLFWNPVVTKRLREGVFDAVLVGGYNHPTMLRAMDWCTRTGTAFHLMCESHLMVWRDPVRRLLKQGLLRWVVKHMAGGLPTGSLAEEYLVHYGADAQRLTHLPNAPDVERIRADVNNSRCSAQVRAEARDKARPTVLFVGRLIRRKGVYSLVEAVARLRDRSPVDLIFVGDGTERSGLQRRVAALGLEGFVRFTGFLEPHEISAWYAKADLFSLPSSETWGVVVLEALAAGLPVVLSDRVGCHPDIVGGLDIGRIVPFGNVDALADAIEAILRLGLSPDRVERSWREVFEGLKYEALAESLVSHIHRCQSASPRETLQPAPV